MVNREQRAVLAEIQRAIQQAQTASDEEVRVFRGILMVAIGVLLAAAIIFPLIVLAIPPDVISMRPVAEGAARENSLTLAGDLVWVEIAGAIGGLVGLIVALRKLNSSKHPARLQLWQLLLKLPAGAVTAAFAVLFLQSGIVPSLKAATTEQIAAYALLFGFAQEAATSLVDRQANRLLEQAKTIDDVAQ
jgi:uncharacterized membrane protein HdeD (DUF308 family)